MNDPASAPSDVLDLAQRLGWRVLLGLFACAGVLFKLVVGYFIERQKRLEQEVSDLHEKLERWREDEARAKPHHRPHRHDDSEDRR